MGDVYRECEECGEQINPKRLKLVPNATCCVACINEGKAKDVFTYRSIQAVDDYGNFHTNLIKDPKVWKQINIEDLPEVLLEADNPLAAPSTDNSD